MKTATIVLIAMLCFVDSSFVAASPPAKKIDGPKAATGSDAADDVEQRRILQALIEAVGYEGSVRPPPEPGHPARPVRQTLVFVDQTVTFCVATRHENDDCTSEVQRTDVVRARGRLPKELLNALWVQSTNGQRSMQPAFPDALSITVNEAKSILGSPDGWQVFRKRFSETAGLLTATRAAVSSSRRQAVIYAAYRCGYACGYGQLHYLTKDANGIWRLSQSVRIWLS